nr:MAG TPA: YaaA [Caudoviricetes sp.]
MVLLPAVSQNVLNDAKLRICIIVLCPKISRFTSKFCTLILIYILSAKHGLLNLDDVIDPYDTELPRKDCEQKTLWKTKVLKQLKQFDNNEDIIFLGAKHYYEPVDEYFRGTKIAPLLGLTPVYQNVKLLEGINSYYDSKKRRLF